MRKIVLDTETTGFSPEKGDRIIEIGCVELIDNEPSGELFHVYLNPERVISEEIFKITGLNSDFLADKPKFIEIVDDFLEFIGNDPIIAHNASFDMGFLNAELIKVSYKALTNQVIDTLKISRKKFQGNNSLNGLCKRYKISVTHREKHGALLDAKLLAKVYGFLCFDEELINFNDEIVEEIDLETFNRNMIIKLSDEEILAHENLIKKIK